MQQFYDITRREIREMELAILAKEKEMEVLEENHRVEVRVSGGQLALAHSTKRNETPAHRHSTGVRPEGEAPGVRAPEHAGKDCNTGEGARRWAGRVAQHVSVASTLVTCRAAATPSAVPLPAQAGAGLAAEEGRAAAGAVRHGGSPRGGSRKGQS